MEETYKIIIVIGHTSQFAEVVAYMSYSKKDPAAWFSTHIDRLKPNDPLSKHYSNLKNLRFFVVCEKVTRADLASNLFRFNQIYRSQYGAYYMDRFNTIDECERAISAQEKRVETVKQKAKDRKAAEGNPQGVDPYIVFQLQERVAKLESDLTFFVSNAQEVFKNLNARLDILEPKPLPPWLEK